MVAARKSRDKKRPSPDDGIIEITDNEEAAANKMSKNEVSVWRGLLHILLWYS
jgi:hypothetical protein